MATQELKKRLIERINEINDPDIIDNLYKHLELELDLKSEETYILTKEEEQALDEAEKDVISKRILTEEEAKNRIRKWIS
ncbi:MAG TPA: hypothetical protein VI603_02710 [Saprospiraceae bacterium]|nr:hypothetical protein [Saprospiraceae bacterium]